MGRVPPGGSYIEGKFEERHGAAIQRFARRCSSNASASIAETLAMLPLYLDTELLCAGVYFRCICSRTSLFSGNTAQQNADGGPRRRCPRGHPPDVHKSPRTQIAAMVADALRFSAMRW
jgi:hypothetical protein